MSTHCVSGVQTKVEKGSPSVALTCSKRPTPSRWGWKGQGQEQRMGRQNRKFLLMLYCSEEICCERICSSAFLTEIVEQDFFFFFVQESVIIGLVKKNVFFSENSNCFN